MKNEVWFCKSYGFCSEYFIIGDPRGNKDAYVFCRDTQTNRVIHYNLIGVFDDYTRVRQIPMWVRPHLLSVLASKNEKTK